LLDHPVGGSPSEWLISARSVVISDFEMGDFKLEKMHRIVNAPPETKRVQYPQ
jgi:hypothetical protein